MLAHALTLVIALANPPLPRQELILIDDRPLKAQASPAQLQSAAAQIGKRTGVTTILFSAVKKLDAKAFAACADAKCLAEIGRKHGADVVVTLRIEKREGVLVLSAARIPALAKVKRADDTRLARNDAELVTALSDAIAKLFPNAQPQPQPAPPPMPPAPTTTAPPASTTPPAPTR